MEKKYYLVFSLKTKNFCKIKEIIINKNIAKICDKYLLINILSIKIYNKAALITKIKRYDKHILKYKDKELELLYLNVNFLFI